MDSITIPEPTNNYAGYRQVVRETALEAPEAWTFKSSLPYRRVLEHVEQVQAQALLAWGPRAFPDLWDAAVALLPEIAHENDRFGMPIGCPLPELGLTCSTTNVRYLTQALRLLTHARDVGMQRTHVIELGGGYGGLALYVQRLKHLVPTLWIEAYTIVDLEEVTVLQNRYADVLRLPFHAVNGLDAQRLGWCLSRSTAPRFLFSAYAFGEFDADMRAWYEHLVARTCVHGVLLWNFCNGVYGVADKDLGGPVYQFVDAPLTVEDDEPAMYAEGVKLVRF